ncbi:MAG: heparinase II/III family protein, partial [Clostridia bacterium]
GATADDSKHLSQNRILPAYANTKDPEFGQILYFANGNKLDGLHYDIFTKNPESLQDDVKRDIAQYGEYQFDKSVNIPGYGFAALRSGSLYQSAMGKPVDTQSTFWMYYGRGAGHGHKDSLNLGIEALGLNIAPELGYPRNTTADDYMNWGQTTVSHNTVMVNDMPQKRMLTGGKPFHFDDSGRVKIMDADAAHQYGIDTYRRTVVNVSVDDENSYAVDFFRVKGGNEHVYSFHALSDTIAETAGLDNIVPQKNEGGDYIGSYAGADVPYATEKIVSGYAWLKNVDRAANVKGGNFMVDFKIKDFRGKYKDPS